MERFVRWAAVLAWFLLAMVVPSVMAIFVLIVAASLALAAFREEVE